MDSNDSERLLKVLEAQFASRAERLENGASHGVRGAVRVDNEAGESSPAVEQFVPTAPGYLPEIYDAQRDIGLRKSSGAAKLKKLKPKHKKLLALHLAGWPNNAIADHMGWSAAWVATVLSDPLCKEVVTTFDDLHEEEFRRLKILANDALRDALQPTKPDRTRLQAARTYYQREAQVNDPNKDETAEDVMQRILQRIEAENVQINIHNHSGNGQS